MNPGAKTNGSRIIRENATRPTLLSSLFAGELLGDRVTLPDIALIFILFGVHKFFSSTLTSRVYVHLGCILTNSLISLHPTDVHVTVFVEMYYYRLCPVRFVVFF
jgi:hypothetical protein